MVGAKQSQASAFEDDDDVSPVAPPRRVVPADEKPLVVVVAPVEPEVRLPSARQQKLEEITEVEQEH